MSKPYISKREVTICNVCGEQKDTRCGACFECSDFVVGKKIGDGLHKLWDSRDPENSWIYNERVSLH